VEKLGAQTQPEAVLSRMRAMGLRARLAPDGESALASLRLGPAPFETPAGPRRIEEVVFASVGADRIKCLRPRTLFQLPLIRVLDCRDSAALEARIRESWEKHRGELVRARQWLESIGVEVEVAEQGSLLRFAIEGEHPDARASLFDLKRVVLPSQGPLSGLKLDLAEDRSLALDRGLGSSVDLEIAISNRLEQLARLAARVAASKRSRALRANTGVDYKPAGKRSHCILLVGPRLADDRSCADSLRLRGYEVRTAHGAQQAFSVFASVSPELVLAEMDLGRSEGTEFVLGVRQLAGIEALPVVLVDDVRREARREAARRVGAAGYLALPIDVPKIARRLGRLVAEPRRRRFTRYNERLSVRIEGAAELGLATMLGRGGMFVLSDHDLPPDSLHRCEIRLPGSADPIRVETEVVYHDPSAAQSRPGIGMRFHSFESINEALLIGYLRGLHGLQPGV